MTPFLSTLPPLLPSSDGDLRLGDGVSELDGAAAFATLLSGALLRSAAAGGEGDVPAEAALTQEAGTEAGPSAEESESPEADEADSSFRPSDAATATASVPLAFTTTPPISASETGEVAPPAMPHPDRPAPALPTPSADVSPSKLPPSASAPVVGTTEQPLVPSATSSPATEAPVLTTGSEAAVDPTTSDLSNDGPALPVEASMADLAHPVKAVSSPSPTTADAPMPEATATTVDAEVQSSEPTPPTDLSEPASPLEPTALEPTAASANSIEAVPEPAGDDASTEPEAQSTDDAEPAAAQQQEGSFEGDGQSPQDQAPDEPLADRTVPAPDQTEADPSIPPMSEAADGPAASARAETPPSLQRTLPVAWLRAVLDQPLRGLTPGAARQSLQISLDDGEGTLTIETHRDNDRVSVSVAFSDGHLRSLASASADRIHAVLQEHFGASVDLSLTSDGSDDAPSDGRNDWGTSRSVPRADLAAPARATASPSRARLSGGRHEWVG